MYEKRFIHSYSFEFVPLISRTTAGTVHMAPEYDPADTAPSGPTQLSTLATSRGYVSGSASAKLVCRMPNYRLPCGSWVSPTLFNGPLEAPRLSSFGKLYVAGDGIGVAADAAYGHVIMHYDITFILPQLDTTTYFGSSGVDRLGVKLTTTSGRQCSDIANAYGLTFQNAAGGSTTIPVDESICAVLDSITGDARMFSSQGKELGPGTRLWMRAANYTDGGAIAGSHNSSSAEVGNLSTSRDFSTGAAIHYLGSAATAAFILRDAFRVGNSPL